MQLGYAYVYSRIGCDNYLVLHDDNIETGIFMFEALPYPTGNCNMFKFHDFSFKACDNR